MAEADLSGRVAIVTGSGRRNGRTIARRLAGAGAAVVVNARVSRGEADQVVREIVEAGGRAVACLADVSREDEVERLIATAVESFGGLDILVNNAALRAQEGLADISFARWREVTSIILDGAFLTTKHAAPHLRRSKAGRIVNITGITGHKGVPNRSHVIAAKSGLIGFTKAIALELAPEVTVNCVSPGRIEDEDDAAEELTKRAGRPTAAQIPLQRMGRTGDVAATVKFLCSDEASYITGQVIHVNGGAYMG
jgi:3-oxoacyl-[acyl-carrier protein] reductase